MNAVLKRIPIRFLEEKIPRLLFILTAVLFLASLLFVALTVGRLGTPVILHFDHTNGIDLFGTRAGVWGIVLLGFAIMLANTLFAEYFFSRERVITYLFLAADFLVGILLFLIVAVIAAVN